MTRRCAPKMAQTFFVLDADTHAPVCFTTGAARTATVAAQELLELAATILNPEPGKVLVLADCEHFTAELMDHVKDRTRFELLVPMPNQRASQAKLRSLPTESFKPRWAGYATAKQPYTPALSQAGPFTQYIQREGERPQDYRYHAFLSTIDGDEVEALVGEFPKRWHVEEFFKNNEALGWDRAGTCNLNIRYGQMTMALVAEAALSQFRKRIGVPSRTGMRSTWRRDISGAWRGTCGWWMDRRSR